MSVHISIDGAKSLGAEEWESWSVGSSGCLSRQDLSFLTNATLAFECRAPSDFCLFEVIFKPET